MARAVGTAATCTRIGPSDSRIGRLGFRTGLQDTQSGIPDTPTKLWGIWTGPLAPRTEILGIRTGLRPGGRVYGAFNWTRDRWAYDRAPRQTERTRRGNVSVFSRGLPLDSLLERGPEKRKGTERNGKEGDDAPAGPTPGELSLQLWFTSVLPCVCSNQSEPFLLCSSNESLPSCPE